MLLKKAGTDSLALAVELFNRPSRTARDEAVLLLLGHSFEMVLKAVIYQKLGQIRDRGDRYTYDFGRAVTIAYSNLQAIEAEHLPVLRAIQQDRNAAAHETISMSDDLLWLHVRSAVTIYDHILGGQFQETLESAVPGHVVPVSRSAPVDPIRVIEQEMVEIGRLLAPRTRRGDEARSRLRPLLALDGSATGRDDPPEEREVDRAARSLQSGRPWRTIFPGLAQLELTDAPSPGSAEVTLRVSRTEGEVAVRQASHAEDESALLYRRSDPFQEFNIKLSQFGQQLGLSRHAGQALIWHLRLKEDKRAYFCHRNQTGNIVYQGLNARALHLAKEALACDQDDLETVTREYNRRHSSAATRQAEGLSR